MVHASVGTVTAHPIRRAGTSQLRRRRTRDWGLWGASAVGLALVVIPVVSVVGGIIARAVPHWHWGVLTGYTQGGSGPGLLNAIEGTFVIVVGVAVIAGLLGVAGGLYLAEFVPAGRGQVLRGASEVLAGVPSIVFGFVGFTVLVVALHWGYGLAAALPVLSLFVVPYVVKTTEVAVRNVPTSYREGAEALGMRSGYALRKVVLRPALPGIATGLIVALAFAVGETAPLLYTAGWSDHPPVAQLTHAPIGYLTYPVYTFYNLPSPSAHDLGYDAALLLVVLVLVLIVLTRVVVALTQRYSPDRAQRVGRRR